MPKGLSTGPGPAILGQPKDAFVTALNLAANKRVREERGRKEDEQKLRQRNAQFAEYMRYQKPKIFEPFEIQVDKSLEDYRDWVTDNMTSGIDPYDPMFMKEAAKHRDTISSLAHKSTYLKSEIDNIEKALKANPFLDQQTYQDRIFDWYLNADGSGKNLADLNVNNMYQDIISDESLANGGFDFQGYTKAYWDNADDQSFTKIVEGYSKQGLPIEDKKKITYEVYNPVTDPETGEIIDVERDAQGNELLNVTNGVIDTWKSGNKLAERAMKAKLGASGNDVEAQRSFVNQLSDASKKYKTETVSRQNAPRPYSTGRGLQSVDYQNRGNAINTITGAYGADGSATKPTDAAQQLLGTLVGAKTALGDVSDIKFVNANEPDPFDPANVTRPYHRISVQVKATTKSGKNKLDNYEIPMHDSAIAGNLNTLFDTKLRLGSAQPEWSFVSPYLQQRDYPEPPPPGPPEQEVSDRIAKMKRFDKFAVEVLKGEKINGVEIVTAEIDKEPGFWSVGGRGTTNETGIKLIDANSNVYKFSKKEMGEKSFEQLIRKIYAGAAQGITPTSKGSAPATVDPGVLDL